EHHQRRPGDVEELHRDEQNPERDRGCGLFRREADAVVPDEHVYFASTSPSRIANCVSFATERRLSFRIRLARCVPTVRVVMLKREAISLVESLWAAQRSTSRSRSVS